MKKDTMKATEDQQFLFRVTFIDTGAEEAFVTHYRPKHSPISSELHCVFSYLGLKAFDDCPEFDFERCYFRTLRLEAHDDDPGSGNVKYAHRCFGAHQAQFSPAIENLLAANAAVETVGITFLPFEQAGTRMSADIASNVHRAGKPKPAAAAPSKLPDSFDVAISFAGTERAEAEKLAGIVRGAGYDVFYDNFYAEQLWETISLSSSMRFFANEPTSA